MFWYNLYWLTPESANKHIESNARKKWLTDGVPVPCKCLSRRLRHYCFLCDVNYWQLWTIRNVVCSWESVPGFLPGFWRCHKYHTWILASLTCLLARTLAASSEMCIPARRMSLNSLGQWCCHLSICKQLKEADQQTLPFHNTDIVLNCSSQKRESHHQDW